MILALALSVVLASPIALGSEEVRVRLAKGLYSVEVKGLDLKVMVDGEFVSSGVSSQSSIVQIERERRKRQSGWSIRWNSNPKPIFQVGRDLEVQGLSLKMGKLSLPGRIHFLAKDRGTQFDLISHLELERYLMGVLPSEMPISWPLEALKAQAVAARSFVWAVKRNRGLRAFDVESSVLDQAFEYSPESMKSVKWSDKAHLAIQATKGKILVQDKKVVKTYYHSHCGGKTESAFRVWGGKKALTSEDEVRSCQHDRDSEWKFEISKSEVADNLKQKMPELSSSELVGITLDQPNSSNRVEFVHLYFKDGGVQKISSQNFRRVIGFSELKSTLFSLSYKGENLVFTGRGNGHGVGMCQYGAKHLAETGKSYKEILEFYFPKAGLTSKGFPFSPSEGLASVPALDL